ncbi:MAG: type II toxin-antitoxin system VapC family toxin [Desulfovibrio sp.]|jgi:predicted nucleic acid-binding protein|nr:type II toxin-antitoxin system VapC family toxin [Desulfovibrio sp.]
MYLLDTNVVSELRKGNKADRHVAAWAGEVDIAVMYLSVISVLEIRLGILSVRRKDETQANRLDAWLEEQVFPHFADRVLPVDIPVALRCAALHVPDPRSDRDALIAATALVHGLTVVTRNIKDFQATDVSLLNPWMIKNGDVS